MVLAFKLYLALKFFLLPQTLDFFGNRHIRQLLALSRSLLNDDVSALRRLCGHTALLQPHLLQFGTLCSEIFDHVLLGLARLGKLLKLFDLLELLLHVRTAT